jgi:HTH-type transcriptional regulator / antitoxin HigA
LNYNHSAECRSAATLGALLDIAPIKNRRDYQRALKEIDALMNAKRNTAEGDRFDLLVTLVEAWEAEHWRLDLADTP